MQVLLFNPEVAFRDCDHCLVNLYDESTGKVKMFHGQPVERLPSVPAPCRTDKGCPKGTPEDQKVLSAKNQRAYQHWKECKAVGQFPDDGLVRFHASIIQELVDLAAERKQFQMLSMMMLGKGM
ncbi:hypothetical protein [Gimesia sp.]|uniref:hypothetical protein n=1 Tax=Gimesia sp. TaxID=2024833 RepID=UPI003A949216